MRFIGGLAMARPCVFLVPYSVSSAQTKTDYVRFLLYLHPNHKMNVLSVENLTKSYGDRLLFENIQFGIEKGQKVALVAKNGSGKTSLLRILSGQDHADNGTVSFQKNINVKFLEQDTAFDPEITVVEAIYQLAGTALQKLAEYERLVQEPNTPAKVLEDLLGELMELDSWQKEQLLREVSSALKLPENNQKIKSLSGGQKKRIALAACLAQEPDFLILDEPTNHLDIDMIEWLQEYLSASQLTLLIVTHDRYFLNEVCDSILEIDQKKLFNYQGNYTYYLEKKALQETIDQSQFEKNQNTLRKELEWVRKMPRARGTKSKSRMEAYQNLKESNTREKAAPDLKLDMKMSRLGSKIISLDKVNKQFDTQIILKDFSYSFKVGERIGIVGKNGIGKSTFLNILMGLAPANAGIIERGETLVFGYYAQHDFAYDKSQRILDLVKDIAEFIPLADGSLVSASQFLERFLFPKSQQHTFVDKLSGGEKRRLYLLTILIKNPNFLILDEPTNNLDLPTIQVLEDFLASYKGCLLVVSHDRYFMDKIVDHLFVLKGEGEVLSFTGTYDQYRREALLEELPTKKSPEMAVPKNEKSSKQKPKNPVAIANLEAEIQKLEADRDALTLTFNQEGLSHEEMRQNGTALEKINELIAQKTEQWLTWQA